MIRLTRRTFVVAALALWMSSLAWAGQDTKLDITGTWILDVQTEAGSGNPTLTFKQEGEKLSGHYSGTLGEADFTGSLKGKEVAFNFSAEAQGFSLPVVYKGTVETATTMKGTLDINGVGSGTFTGVKK